jgi:hypothetical protein
MNQNWPGPPFSNLHPKPSSPFPPWRLGSESNPPISAALSCICFHFHHLTPAPPAPPPPPDSSPPSLRPHLLPRRPPSSQGRLGSARSSVPRYAAVHGPRAARHRRLEAAAVPVLAPHQTPECPTVHKSMSCPSINLCHAPLYTNLCHAPPTYVMALHKPCPHLAGILGFRLRAWTDTRMSRLFRASRTP